MKKLIIIILALTIIFTGCGVNVNPDHKKISDWQYRQMETTEALKDELIIEWPSRIDIKEKLHYIRMYNHYIEYQSESVNYFRTYQEVVENDFKGDCEDISFYYYELIRRNEIVPDSGLYLRWGRISSESYHTVLIVDHPEGEIVIDNGVIKDSIEFENIVAEYDLFSIFS